MKKKISLAIIDAEVLFRKGISLFIRGLEEMVLSYELESISDLLNRLNAGHALPDIAILNLKTKTGD